MDPRDRAEAALARARARGRHVITPDDAVSPMDACRTMQIPRAVVAAADTDRQADATMVIPAEQIRAHDQQYPAGQYPLVQATQPIPHPVSQYPPQYPAEEPDESPAQHHYDGLVPTVQRPAPRRSVVSRRLEGH